MNCFRFLLFSLVFLFIFSANSAHAGWIPWRHYSTFYNKKYQPALKISWRAYQPNPKENPQGQWKIQNNTTVTLYDVSIEQRSYTVTGAGFDGYRIRESTLCSAALASDQECKTKVDIIKPKGGKIHGGHLKKCISFRLEPTGPLLDACKAFQEQVDPYRNWGL